MFGYVYYIKNIVNGRPYVGSHVSCVFDNKYYGSGNLIRRAVKKYGKKSFKIRIIYKASCADDLYEKETHFILKLKQKHGDKAYNISNHALKPMLGLKHSEETKRKYSLDRTGENNPMYGVMLVGALNPMYGVKMSEETKKKISDANSKIFGENHGNYGKVMSEETRKKLSKSKLGLISSSSPNDIINNICENNGIYYSMMPSYMKNIITSFRLGVWQKEKTIKNNIRRFCDYMSSNDYFDELINTYSPNKQFYGKSRWA